MVEAGVSCSREPAVLVVAYDLDNIFIFVGELSGNIGCGVGRGIIDDDDLKTVESLPGGAAHSLFEVFLRVIGRHYHRDGWAGNRVGRLNVF